MKSKYGQKASICTTFVATVCKFSMASRLLYQTISKSACLAELVAVAPNTCTKHHFSAVSSHVYKPRLVVFVTVFWRRVTGYYCVVGCGWSVGRWQLPTYIFITSHAACQASKLTRMPYRYMYMYRSVRGLSYLLTGLIGTRAGGGGAI